MITWQLMLTFVLAASSTNAEPDVADYPLVDVPMNRFPVLEQREHIQRFDPRLLDLWLAALDQPDANTRRQAVDAMARAHAMGMSMIDERAGNRMIHLLRSNAEHDAVRFAAAKALGTIGVERAADIMLDRNRRDGVAMVLLTDPALARWRHQASINMWIQRLEDPQTSKAVLTSAMRSLGEVNTAEAARPLRQIVSDRGRDQAVRLVAARALGAVQKSGLEPLAIAPLNDTSPTIADRLISATLLRHHGSAEADRILLNLIDDTEPAVVSVAALSLLQRNSARLWPHVETLCGSPDAHVRTLALQVLEAHPSEEAVIQLVLLLHDPNPALRAAARSLLHRADRQSDLSDAVRRELMTVLRGNQYHGVRQAAVLLGRLQHAPAREKLLELLTAPRHPTRLCAIVGLRWLGDRSTLPIVFDRLRSLAQAWAKARNDPSKVRRLGYIPEMAQLIQMLGVHRYENEKADRFLRQFISRNSNFFTPEVRGAAIWTLGRLYEDEPDNELAMRLLQRILDAGYRFQEHHYVRQQSAIALGMMDAGKISVPGRTATVQDVLHMAARDQVHDEGMVLACRWSLQRMSDASPAPLRPSFAIQYPWFLAPVGNPR